MSRHPVQYSINRIGIQFITRNCHLLVCPQIIIVDRGERRILELEARDTVDKYSRLRSLLPLQSHQVVRDEWSSCDQC